MRLGRIGRDQLRKPQWLSAPARETLSWDAWMWCVGKHSLVASLCLGSWRMRAIPLEIILDVSDRSCSETALVQELSRFVREPPRPVTAVVAEFRRPLGAQGPLCFQREAAFCRHETAHASSDVSPAAKPALHFAQLLRRDPRISAGMLVKAVAKPIPLG
ncbi:hypothetical protein L1887_47417 [Cichorium endivia]|nr:hypothetical protein L1887_47417 [Cichorium endivia]